MKIPKQIYYFGYNPNNKGRNEKYFERMESLNKLNSKVFSDNEINYNNEMNDIFFKFRKKK